MDVESATRAKADYQRPPSQRKVTLHLLAAIKCQQFLRKEWRLRPLPCAWIFNQLDHVAVLCR